MGRAADSHGPEQPSVGSRVGRLNVSATCRGYGFWNTKAMFDHCDVGPEVSICAATPGTMAVRCGK